MRDIYLQGSEDVSRAAGTMRDAANTMNDASRNMYGAFEQYQRFLDDWLQRLETVLNNTSPVGTE